MSAVPSRRLTEKQRAVLERVDRRVPIKVIANELGVSESRINQHIRALKDIFGVESLGELIERARDCDETPLQAAETPYRKPAYTKPHLADSPESRHNEDRVAPGEFVLADAVPFAIEAPWKASHEPQVVPGVLDGENAVLFRLAVIVGLAFAIIVLVILAVTAALSVSEALEGKEIVNASQQRSGDL